MAADEIDLTAADEIDLTADDDGEAATTTAAGTSGPFSGTGSSNPGLAARPMPWVHGLLGCKGKTDVMPSGLPEPAMLNVRLCDLVCGPDLQAVLSFNFCSTLTGFLDACPAVRAADYLLFADQYTRAKEELPVLRCNGARLPRRVDFHKPILRDMADLGTHHTKALLLRYPTGLRVIVLTGTLDPERRTHFVQGAWWQDFPLLCPLPTFAAGCTLEDCRPSSQFGGVLFDFVECSLTGRPHRGEWGTLQVLDMIAQHDFSLARAALVASVPGPESGVHRGAAVHKWGHLALRGILERQGLLETFRGSVLSGTSSLNYMVPSHVLECERSFGGSLKLLWCSRDQVRTMLIGGFNGGNVLTGKRDALQSKEVKERLHYHEGLEAVGRQHCPPHIKQTAWLGEDGRLEAVMMGSHNFSQAAWGLLSLDKGSLLIRSYELSVVCFPSLEAAWRRSQQFTFSCTPLPGAPPLGPDPAMEGCARVEFVAFASADTEARQPCAVSAADGCRVLRVPAPLTFSTHPAKYDLGAGSSDEPWYWAHDYGDLRDANGLTWREAQARAQRDEGDEELSLLERMLMQEAMAESHGKGSSGGGAGSHWAAAAAAVGDEQRRAAKRQLDEWEEEEEEEDEFMQQGVLESLRCSRQAEEAALQRALLASAQEDRSGPCGSWQPPCSKRAGGVSAGLQADDESPAVQQALLDSMQL